MNVSKADIQGVAGVIAVENVINNEFGWIIRNQPLQDVGIDALVETVSNNQTDGGLFAIQIKSGKSWFNEITSTGIIFRTNLEHLDYWLDYPLPVLIILNNPNGKIYWQIVTKETAKRLSNGCKIEIPYTNSLTINNKEVINNLCHFHVNSKTYSILGQGDESHGLAKRYSFNVLLNNKLSNAEITQLIIDLTKTKKNEEYYRSDLVKARWQNTSATVVWIFIYISYEDSKNCNWVCMAQWISNNLDSNSAPTKINGLKIDNELVIDWSKNYKQLSEIFSTEMSKAEYLPISKEIISLSEKYLRSIEKIFLNYKSNKIDKIKFSNEFKKLINQIEVISNLNARISIPPLECYDFNECLECYICAIDNMKIVFQTEKTGRNTLENRDWLINMYIESAQKYYGKLKYELEKITQ